jgi:hypothetical protein
MIWFKKILLDFVWKYFMKIHNLEDLFKLHKMVQVKLIKRFKLVN